MFFRLKIIVILSIITNTERAFIFSNYSILTELETIKKEEFHVNQDEEIKKICKDKKCIDTLFSKTYISSTDIELPFIPEKISIPRIKVVAPIIASNDNNDVNQILDSGIVNYKNQKNNSTFLFGHSSSFNKGPYQYIFTRLPRLTTGDKVLIESDREIRIYNFSRKYIKNPDELERLESDKNTLFLVTCYPFLTSYKRYVVELKLDKEITKK